MKATTRERHLTNRWFATGTFLGILGGYTFGAGGDLGLLAFEVMLVWSGAAGAWWWLSKAPRIESD